MNQITLSVPRYGRELGARFDWRYLAKFQCAKCHSRLRILRTNKKFFVCRNDECSFVVSTEKRERIATYYPRESSETMRLLSEKLALEEV